MTTLNELKEQVDGLRYVVRMADSDSVETRQLLRAQTKLMVALRQNQNAMIQEQKTIRIVLENQAEALGELVLSLNSVQGRVSSLTKDLVGLKGEVAKMNKHLGRMDQRQGQMDQRQDRMDQRQGQMDQRQDRMDQRQDRMDQRQDRMEQWQDRMDQRQDRMDQRQDRMDQRQDRMDKNLLAIMRHLGVEGTEEQ
jgi:chromosome segregation ATPase